MPPALELAGAWAWRVVFVAAAGWILYQILAAVGLLVIPFVAAVFLASLLRPVTLRMNRVLPPPLSALLTLLLALAALAGVGYFVVVRALRGVPSVIDQFVATAEQLSARLQGAAVQSVDLDRIAQSGTDWLQRHRSDAINLITTGAGYTVQILTAVVLTLFICFFLLYDVERIWRWLLRAFPEPLRSRVDRSGRVASDVITGYIRGTVAIATIHGVVIGVVLLVLGTPLAAALTVLVFLGSFIPLIGALVAGGLAVLTTLATGGWLKAAILLGVLLAENQLEAHVLQPLIMGHNVRLHPLAIGLAVTAGTLIGGIFGALLAVPLTAIAYRTLPVLTGRDG